MASGRRAGTGAGQTHCQAVPASIGPIVGQGCFGHRVEAQHHAGFVEHDGGQGQATDGLGDMINEGVRRAYNLPENVLRASILAAIEEFPHIPVCMHQDHGTSPDVCQRSISALLSM